MKEHTVGKRVVAFVGLAVATLLPTFGWAAAVEAPYLTVKKRAPLTWCSMGTSITWYNNHVSAAFTKGYQTRVLEQIVFNSLSNVGVNGGCVSGAYTTPTVADFYTIEHGVNDWGHCTAPGTLDDYKNNTQNGTFAADYRRAVDAIRAKNANAHIILCTPRKAYGFGSYLPATCTDRQLNGYFLKDYVDVINAIAEDEGFTVADFYSTCGEQEELADLSIDTALHPNDAGYQKMANELVKAILNDYPNLADVDETTGAISVPAGMGTYTVAAAATVPQVSVADAVRIGGAAITFDAPGTVSATAEGGQVRFENDISLGYALTATCPVEIAGDLAAGQELIADGADIALCGTRTVGGNPKTKMTSKNGGTIVVPAGAEVTFKDTEGLWNLRIEGTVINRAYSGIPWDGTTTIVDGGVLDIQSALGTWGVGGRAGHIYVQTGGTVKAAGGGAIGLYKAIHLDGGELINGHATGNLLYKIHMKDGGRMTGKNLMAGCSDYYGANDNEDNYNGSFIRTTGETACTVDLESITLGWSKTATAAKPVQLTFKVEAPLIVNSALKAYNSESVDVPSSFGFQKTGTGVLTLASEQTSCANASFIMNGGAVRLPAGAAASFGALVVNGNTSLDVAEGATLSFTGSANATWTAGRKLVLENLPPKKAIYFGVGGLTAAQLEAISYEKNPEELFSLDAEGYLTSPMMENGDLMVVVPDPVTVDAVVSVCTQTEELYFANRSLKDVLDVTMTCWQKFGGSIDERTYTWTDGPLPKTVGTWYDSGLYLLANDGETLTIEFHGRTYGASYDGIGNGFGLVLTQRGSDIYGKVAWYAGFTGANSIFDQSWESKKKSNWNDYNTDATYSTRGSNLKLKFSQAATVERKVRFVGIDGETAIATVAVPAGQYAAVAPTPPAVDGYVFWKWDCDFSNVQASMIVKALYHKLCTVTFKDKDGSVLKTETVEETNGATAPDMTGAAHFIGWDDEFDVITDDKIVTAVYGEIPEAVNLATATGLLDYETGDVLIWTSAEGTWNAENRNWYTAAGVATAWKSGATAVFPIAAEVTVEGAPSVSRIYTIANADTVTFKGEGAATIIASGSILYGCDSTIVAEGTLALGAGTTLLRREQHNQTKGQEGVYLTFDDQLVMPGVSLAEADDIRMTVRSSWGGFGSPRTFYVRDIVSGQEGVYDYHYDSETQSATCQVRIYCGGGQYVTCVKVQFTQGSDGVYAKALYVKHAGNDGSVLSYDRDYDSSSIGRSDSCLSQTDANNGSYNVQIFNINSCIEDVLPTEMFLVAKGNLDLGASVTVRDGVVLKTAGEGLLNGGTLAGDITLSTDAVLELASTAAQTMKGKITVTEKGHGYVITKPGSNVAFRSNKGAPWELRVAGVTYVSEYDTMPQATGGLTKVLDGGTLVMESTNGTWGPQVWHDEGLIVQAGGTLRMTKDNSTGVIMGYLIDGGTATNEAPTLNNILYKWNLKDGATLTGKGMRVGYIDNYKRWSYVKATGTQPSTISLDEIQLGYQVPARLNGYVGIDFQVDDVTSDTNVDLYVSSPITERTGVTLFNEGYRENLGIWKRGAGTIELSASSSACATGVFKMEEGTVRFPAAAKGNFGALIVQGDAALEVDRAARVTFDTSSDMAWTAGKTLTFSGTMGRRSVRIGTSASSVTAAQLAAMVYLMPSGKTAPMTIDADGYLIPPPRATTIILR